MAFRPIPLVTLGLLGACSLALTQPARAHPHVWVSVETTVIYDKQTVTGLRQRWLFDELYSAMAAQGLDANGDGILDRGELAELANTNVEGLKEFGYFTFAKLGDQLLAFDSPTDVLMEQTETAEPPGQDAGIGAAAAAMEDPEEPSIWTRLGRYLTGPAAPEQPKVLAMEFTLPLQKPVLAEADGFNFSTYDPSFFIWFDLIKDEPIKLSGAPDGCRAEVSAPVDEGQAEIQQLSEAAFDQSGGITINFVVGRTVTVSCPK